tara:strand:+ start:2543 stop:3475 length:933 start_codon:yes stop_codon:yes gene_type:complete
MIKKKIILFLSIYFILISPLLGKSVEIKVKIINEIITNFDIDNEKKYLLFLNPALSELENSKIDLIAKNSLITEIIKKSEVEKIFNLNNQESLVSNVEQQLLIKKNIKSKENLLMILKEKNLDYEKVKLKLKIETLWNQLIYNKFSKNVKINKEELRKNILNDYKNKDKKYDYNLSEIIFSETTSNNLSFVLKNIKDSINKIGFENSANIYSLSSTAKNGGLIGWINELQISEKIKLNIKELDINEISKPIKIQSGYLLIKLNDKKEAKQEINLEEQLQRSINQEINRQLNNFSIIFYKRLKKNIEVNEY